MAPGLVPSEGVREVARTLVEPLRATLRRVEGIPISAYEEREGDAVAPLLDEAREVLAAAIDDVGALLDHYDAVAEARASVRRIPIAAPATPNASELCGEVERALGDDDASVRKVQNLAFIARLGLRGRLAALDGMGASSPKWEIIDAAGSSLREILKALGALDLAVCELEGLPAPSTFYVTELERSLQIRRAYRIFHDDVAPSREPEGAEVARRLRRTANAIAKLAGRPIYASMRVHDRFMLRGVQRRVQAWLASVEEDARAREAAGVRLFQDVAHLAELMMNVNERAELRAHDAELATKTADALDAGALDVVAAIEGARVMHGRDAELDAMLCADEPPPRAPLVDRLRAIAAALSPRPASAPAPRPSAGELDDDFL